MKKILLSALLSSMIASGSAMAGTLLVGTDAGLAPFEFKDPKTNEIVGFDIDLINAIAKAVGDEAKIQNMQFAGLIPALQSNMVDVGAAAITITPERQKQVLFTDPYYDVGLVMVIQKKNADKFKTLKDMEGKRICAQIGSTGSILASTVKNATVALYYLTKHNDEDIMMVPHVYNPKQNGFAVAKNNKALLEKLNKGLKIIKENGEYDKIYEKWLGKKPQASQQ